MNLSVSINLFDSEELLEALLINYRNIGVKHISIVYQTISNFGKPCSPKLEQMLNNFYKNNLYDRLVKYSPFNQVCFLNECTKRQVGLDIAKSLKCEYFLSSDCDEFYHKEQFLNCYNMILKEDIHSSFCHINDYHIKPTNKAENLCDYYVPFIYKINKSDFFQVNKFNHPYCDPTRQIKNEKMKIFNPSEIVMNHMTTVRSSKENLIKKYENSSSRANLGDIKKRAEEFWNYEKTPKLINVEDVFNIEQSIKNCDYFYSSSSSSSSSKS